MHGVRQHLAHVVRDGHYLVRVILDIADIGSQFFGNNLFMESNELIAYVVHRNCRISQLEETAAEVV